VRITELESKADLTVKERNELDLHRQMQAVADDPKHFLEADKIARDKYEGTLRDAYYNSGKFREAVVNTSIKEGGKMAFQQAFGLMLVEFFSATFDELLNFYRKGASLLIVGGIARFAHTEGIKLACPQPLHSRLPDNVRANPDCLDPATLMSPQSYLRL